MTTVCLDCAATLRLDDVTGELVDHWGDPLCGASYRAHEPDLGAVAVAPTGAGDHITVRRTERGGQMPAGRGTGAVPAPTVPGKGRSGLRPPRRTRPPAAALDLGHPAAPAAAALTGRRTERRQPAGNPVPQEQDPLGAQRRVPLIHSTREGK